MSVREAGTAVESPSGMWHVGRDSVRTFCGKESEGWKVVPDAVTRGGIWCGQCLYCASRKALGPKP